MRCRKQRPRVWFGLHSERTKGTSIFAPLSSGHAFHLGALSLVRVEENDFFGEALQGAQIWASYWNLFAQVFEACSSSVDDGCCIVTRSRLELTVAIIIASGGGGVSHMRNRDMCRQLRLGKNRSQQLVSIDLCLCYVYNLTFEKFVLGSAYYRPELWVHEDLYRQFSFVRLFCSFG